MSIADSFSTFCNNLRMNATDIKNISTRAGYITQRVNADFRNIVSDTRYSLYVGSYGRGTDIHVSDIDMIVELPYSYYEKYDAYTTNGQSALIQALKESIKLTYSTTHLRGDGQVVKLDFTDGICYEIVPGFINKDEESFTYPNSNNGGSWAVTNPRAEFAAINATNLICNGNLKRLCRMARAWKDVWSVPISGWLIDTLAYNFINQWEYKEKSFLYYDFMTRDFFEYLKNQNTSQQYWLAPGSRQHVPRTGSFEYKALRCYNISVSAINDEKNYPHLAHGQWREIYGGKFPSIPT